MDIFKNGDCGAGTWLDEKACAVYGRPWTTFGWVWGHGLGAFCVLACSLGQSKSICSTRQSDRCEAIRLDGSSMEWRHMYDVGPMGMGMGSLPSTPASSTRLSPLDMPSFSSTPSNFSLSQFRSAPRPI